MESQSTFPYVGRYYRFSYRAHNYFGAREDWESRLIFVTAVRSLDDRPLDQTTLQLNPMLRRGRNLVYGLDCDKGQSRTFYWESMRNLREVSQDECPYLGPMRVAILEADSDPEEVFRGNGPELLAFLSVFLKEQLPPGMMLGVEPLQQSAAA